MTTKLTIFISLFALGLSSGVHAKVMHQDCDGEQKTCCIAEGFSNVPPMWVKAANCPKGMIDDATCTIQYGCKQNEQPELN